MSVCRNHKRPAHEFKLYKKRWTLLLLFALMQIISSFSFASLGQVSDVYVNYFKVNYWQVDWASLACPLGMCVAAPVLACLSYMKIMPLKKMTIFSAAGLVFSNTCIVLAPVSSKAFSLVVIGQLINGFSAGALYTMRPSFAVHWFPDSEVGTAIGVGTTGIGIGGILGFILSPFVLHKQSSDVPKTLQESTFNRPVRHHGKNRTALNGNDTLGFDDVLEHDESTRQHVDVTSFLKLYLPALILSAVVLVLLIIFMQDKPPTPPSRTAMAHQRNSSVDAQPRFSDFLATTLHLSKNTTCIAAMLIYGFVLRTALVEYTMMSQIVSVMKPSLSLSQADTIGGYIMVTLMIGYFVGSLVGGRVVDRFKRHSRVASISIFCTLVSTVGLLISFKLSNLIGLYVFNGLYGAFMFIAVVVLHRITSEATFPLDAIFVSAWLTAVQTGLGCMLASVGRGIFNRFSATGVLSLQCFAMLLSLLISVLIKEQNHYLGISAVEGTQFSPSKDKSADNCNQTSTLKLNNP